MKRFSFLLVLLPLAVACSLSEPKPVGPETRPVDEQLLERLAIAHGAMQDAAGARTVEPAQRYARVVIDAIVGPNGRHGAAVARPDGLLPADGTSLDADPGLALRSYAAAPADSPVRRALTDAIIGAPDRWRVPRDRYDAIDRAVAAYPTDATAISALGSSLERATAWALLASAATDIRDLHALAGNGARETRTALDALRKARAAAR